MPEQNNHSQDPTLRAGNTTNNAERRKKVEKAMGPALDSTFEKHGGFATQVTVDGVDIQQLTLYLEREERSPATINLVSSNDQDGNRVVDMSYAAKGSYDNHCRFTDGPGQKPSLVSCSQDPKTKEVIPQSPDHHNNQDQEIGFWGEAWLQNLENGKPEKPSLMKGLKRLGRQALRALQDL